MPNTLAHRLPSPRLSALAPLLAAWAVLALLAPGVVRAQFGFGNEAPPVSVRAVPQQTQVSPGQQFAIAVVLEHSEGWHSWPSLDQDVLTPAIAEFAIRTAIAAGEVTPPGDMMAPMPHGNLPDWVAAVGPVQWPETHAAPVPNFSGEGGPTVDAQTYSGRAIAYVPVVISPNAEPGEYTLPITVRFQACNDSTCDMPQTPRLEVPVTVVPLGEGVEGGGDATLFTGFDASVFATLGAGDGSSDGGAGPAVVEKDDEAGFEGGAAIVLLILGSVLGGFVLNLTPCVLPIIPIKIMTLSAHAGSKGRTLILGIWMAAGVVAFWLLLGVLAASFSSLADPSRLFGIWWVTLAIGLLIGAMGVGIMGMFTLQLPKAVYMVNPKADSAGGSFMFGVMTAVLGLPCFGFVAGALLAGSATMPAWVVLAIFTSLGVGMALPYLVLSANPNWMNRVPRTGPGSALVKEVMGLLLIAAALYFIASGVFAYIGGRPEIATTMPWWVKQIHWWAIGLVAGGAGLWLIWRTFRISGKTGPRAFSTVLGLIIAVASVGYAVDTTMKARDDFWRPYTAEGLQAAIDSGRVVVLDFTADWCLTCKAMEAAVLTREPVKSRLVSSGVVPIKVDLTSTAAPGWEKLRDLGRTGIPTLAIFGPGLEEPLIYNAYTSQTVMDAIDRASGRVAGQPAPSVTPASLGGAASGG